jgi:hypothetical protein
LSELATKPALVRPSIYPECDLESLISNTVAASLFHATSAIYHSGVNRLLNRATRNLIVAATAAVFSVALYAQSPTQTQTPAQTPPQTPAQPPAASINGTYISTDPLAGVKYDNRWDVSVGLASAHIHAGPNLREGADLGGLDVSGSYWLTKHWGVEGSGRAYMGTSGTTPAAAGPPYNESGVFISEYMFLAGPEYLGPHNKHAAVIFHALLGGAYGDFNKEIGRAGSTTGPTGVAAFYDNQVALGGAIGGHIDLNRSPNWVFRVTPDALLTGYDGTSQYSHTQWNFGISVGVQYKFKKKR